MKKWMRLLPVMLAAFALAACTPSEIKSEESVTMPSDALRVEKSTEAQSMAETSAAAYSIPADAPTGVDGGPGMMETTTADAKANYPADKQIVGEDSGTVVCLYTLDETGINQLFDSVETCDADSLTAALVNNSVLTDGTVVESFSVENGVGKLKLNKLEGGYKEAKEEELAACVVNTFTDNLDLNAVELSAGGKDYGEKTYTDEYDAT